MDDIQEMIDRLPELSDADLDTLEGKIVQRFETVEAEEITRETVNEMTYLADSVESVRAEIGRRADQVAKLATKASEASARLKAEGALTADAEVTDEGTDEALSTTPPEDEEVPPADAEPESPEDEEEPPPAKKKAPVTFATEEPTAEPKAEDTELAVEEPKAEEPKAETTELATDESTTEAPVAEATELATEAPEAKAQPEPEVAELAAAEPEIEAVTVEVTELATEEPEVEVTVTETTELATDEPEVEAPVAEVAELATDEPEAVATEPASETVELAAEAEPAAEEIPSEATELATEEPKAEEPEAAIASEAAVTDEVTLAADTEDATELAVEGDDGSDQPSTEAHMDTTSAGTFSAPADRQPVPRQGVSPAPMSLVAGGDIPGITAGSSLQGRDDLASAFATRLHSLRRVQGNSGEQVVVASLMATFPEDRTLRNNEVDSNTEKIQKITDPFSIVASGGWCAPLPVNYDIFDIGGSTATPVRDALPVFNADRGGVRYIIPPTIADYVGAVAIWTNQDDIDAATDPDKKKACLVVQCAQEDSVYLDAVTMCMCFGNLQTRAFPELIAKHNELALVQAARFGETYILDAIKGKSTAVGPIGPVLGTGRDVLISVERAATAYRYAHRLDPNLPLRFIAPQWLHAMIRSDITAQLPGDGMDTTFALADDAINRFFTSRNINPVWALEGPSGGDVPEYTDFPDVVEWALFAEGTFTLLDGGTLDIGIVRDMDLVQKNDYCMFTEAFLAVAKTGLEGIWVTENFNVNGGSAGTLDVAAVDF